MKKTITSIFLMALAVTTAYAQRYVNEVFPSVNVTHNVTYANNFQVLSGTPSAVDLKMDVYVPDSDTVAHRPLIIFLHTGNFLPAINNQTPTGSRNDSSTVELCKRFARRGYVVANIDYRLGWTPNNTNLDIRRGSFACALYRAVQDVHAAIRFFHKDAAISNNYKIDPTKIILGGEGTGGTIALSVATLKDTNQLFQAPFISSSTVINFGFIQGHPYINPSMLGDIEGMGGNTNLNNPSNSVGYASEIRFVFTLGGSLIDSSWLKAGNVPMIGFQCHNDPFNPYMFGDLIVVPDVFHPLFNSVTGAGFVIPTAVIANNNSCFFPNNFTDSLTLHASLLNGGFEGLYPFLTDSVETSPWEWFDSTATSLTALSVGFTQSHADSIFFGALKTNPFMSKEKAMAYIDTVMNYLNPRINLCLNLNPTSIQEFTNSENSVSVYPNPASDEIHIASNILGNNLKKVIVTDVVGKVMIQVENIHAQQILVRSNNLASGIYFIEIEAINSKAFRKILIQ